MATEYALSNLALSRLKIARIADLNDPFELLAANLGNDRELRRGIRAWREELNNSVGMLCFSLNWQSPVQWSHYADKHRGICFGFDIQDSQAMRVRYSSKRIPVRYDGGSRANGFDQAFVQEMLLTKYAHWQYESEVRLFQHLDPASAERGLYFLPFSKDLVLREIILGPLCEIPIERVRELVAKAYPDVLVLKARLAFKWYSVVPDERTLAGKYVIANRDSLPIA